MALITTIEINHDKANVFRDDPRFGENLYLALAHRYGNLNERILRNYGITIKGRRHSSDKPPKD